MRRQPLPARLYDPAPSSAQLIWPGKDFSNPSALRPALVAARASWDLRGQVICGERAEGLLVQGDAGLALSELLATTGEHAITGTVKLCYIDPPYNTGESDKPS